MYIRMCHSCLSSSQENRTKTVITLRICYMTQPTSLNDLAIVPTLRCSRGYDTFLLYVANATIVTRRVWYRFTVCRKYGFSLMRNRNENLNTVFNVADEPNCFKVLYDVIAVGRSAVAAALYLYLHMYIRQRCYDRWWWSCLLIRLCVYWLVWPYVEY